MRKFLLSIGFMCIFTTVAFSQTKTITGVVNDDNGEALIAATVREPGTSNAVLTGIEGDFTIDVPVSTQALSISYVGFEDQTVDIANTNNVNVQLLSTNTIEQVVITTYGKDGATPLPGATTLISAEQIEGVPIASFEQILQGKAPGLSVLSGSGQPGTAATVRIRGVGSIQGSNAPLYILDGIQIQPSEFASLNPNDFEVAAILKDAASTSIYGSRASNGVILLKTKTGKAGKTKINFSSQFGVSNPARQQFEMMNSAELLAFQEIAGRGAGWSLSPQNPANAGLTPAELQDNANELARLRANDIDLRDVFFREGKTRTHDLSFRGGTEKSQFFVSLSYYDEEGIGIRSELQRKSARVNFDNQISDKFRLSAKGYVGSSNSTFIESENGIALANGYAAVYLANPFETLRDDAGTILFQGNDPEGINRFAGYVGANALARLNQDTNGRDELKGTGSFSLEYDIIENLTLKGFAGVDYRTRFTERFQDPDGYGGGLVGIGQQGSIAETTTRLQTSTIQPTLNYNKEFGGGDHFVSALVGYEFLDREYLRNAFTGFGLNNLFPGITPGSITYTNDDGESVANVGGNKTRNQLSSGFANVSYTLKDKYELGGGIRRDASSRFGPNNKEATFWSASARWILDQEEFLSSSDVVDLLRLRGSYGTTGNQEFGGGLGDGGNFPYVATLGAGTNGPNSTLLIGNLPNPDLQWESAKKANIGVDFGLFNRLNGSFDVYNDITENLLLQRAISGTTGQYTISPFNAGSVRNRGAELEIDYDLIQTETVNWNIGANIAYNENEILNLGGESEFPSGTSIIRVGEELGAHYIVGWAGVDPATGDPIYQDGSGGITKDFNVAEPTTGWGTFNAPYIGGFNSTVSWKGLSVFAQFNYAADYSRFNNQTFFQENPNFAQFNMSRIMNTIWQQPGDVTEIQRIGTARQFSSKDIEDADFLRFRNLRASYSIPQTVLGKLNGVESINLFANGTNLYTWTKFTGFDPEDSNNIAGYEYPLPRQLTFGLNVGF